MKKINNNNKKAKQTKRNNSNNYNKPMLAVTQELF